VEVEVRQVGLRIQRHGGDGFWLLTRDASLM
jgi:hypothetical protein